MKSKRMLCVECSLRPVSLRLLQRYGVALFCSTGCAERYAHMSAGNYNSCAGCRRQSPADDWDANNNRCPHCDLPLD